MVPEIPALTLEFPPVGAYIEVARPGRTLKRHELAQSLKVIEQNHAYLLEEWHEYKRKAG